MTIRKLSPFGEALVMILGEGHPLTRLSASVREADKEKENQPPRLNPLDCPRARTVGDVVPPARGFSQTEDEEHFSIGNPKE